MAKSLVERAKSVQRYSTQRGSAWYKNLNKRQKKQLDELIEFLKSHPEISIRGSLEEVRSWMKEEGLKVMGHTTIYNYISKRLKDVPEEQIGR